MNRFFPLAGLLRVRKIQEQAAAERLSRASIAADQTKARERHVRAALAGTDMPAVDVRSLSAIAAARVAGRSLLSDLGDLAKVQQEQVEAARAEHQDARRAVRGLDRLEQAHRARRRVAELSAEQAELDEVAARTSQEGAA